MHWGEDDEDSSEEDDQQLGENESSTTPQTPTSIVTNSDPVKESTVSLTMKQKEDLNQDELMPTSSSAATESTANASTNANITNINVNGGTMAATSQARPRTASVEDFYRSLDPTNEEISSYVDKHGACAGTMMATAKPLSRVLRAKLSELLTEQERLLQRIHAQKSNTKAMPQMKESMIVLDRIPEYQKKLLWIKGSMQRTQSMVDQMKKQSLSLQAQVQLDVVASVEKKRTEQQRDAQMKAQVVTR
jgi:hypothetical protein